MSRWDAIMPKLPRFLQSSDLLDKLAALDAQYELEKLNGHFTLTPHYGGGEPRFVDLGPQTIRISLDGQSVPTGRVG